VSYRAATRYGLTHIEPTEQLRASGWRQVWEHPSGMLAMRHPSAGYWVVAERVDGVLQIGSGWSSSLRAAALSIERRNRAKDSTGPNRGRAKC
jgi:hypothetical protein